MRIIINYAFLFLLFFGLQVFVFNKLEIGYGALIFFLPLFLMILPFDTNVFVLMLLGFFLGISVDALSNTYGLNASSLVLFAYLRPMIFDFFRPREGYDPLKIPSARDMGWEWFAFVYGVLFLISLSWFCIWEIFSAREILLVLRNIISSFFASSVVVILSQLFVFNTRRNK